MEYLVLTLIGGSILFIIFLLLPIKLQLLQKVIFVLVSIVFAHLFIALHSVFTIWQAGLILLLLILLTSIVMSKINNKKVEEKSNATDKQKPLKQTPIKSDDDKNKTIAQLSVTTEITNDEVKVINKNEKLDKIQDEKDKIELQQLHDLGSKEDLKIDIELEKPIQLTEVLTEVEQSVENLTLATEVKQRQDIFEVEQVQAEVDEIDAEIQHEVKQLESETVEEAEEQLATEENARKAQLVESESVDEEVADQQVVEQNKEEDQQLEVVEVSEQVIEQNEDQEIESEFADEVDEYELEEQNENTDQPEENHVVEEKADQQDLTEQINEIMDLNEAVDVHSETTTDVNSDPDIEANEVTNETSIKAPKQLNRELMDTLVGQLLVYKKHLNVHDFEQLVLDYKKEGLHDNDYYLFAAILRDHYIETEQFDKLKSLLIKLKQRYNSKMVIKEEITFFEKKFIEK